MMAAIFGTLSLALAAERWGPRRLALIALLACLALTIGLFLFEIESPVDGFRMPWLNVWLDAPVPAGRAA